MGMPDSQILKIFVFKIYFGKKLFFSLSNRNCNPFANFVCYSQQVNDFLKRKL